MQFHFIDGTAYTPSDFGSTDSVTGEWKINTAPSVNYGTNGFFILKDGNSVTDQSGNSNNFTVAGGTLTKTEDCPSNVFATWNPLWKSSVQNNIGFNHGNTTWYPSSASNTHSWGRSTLGWTLENIIWNLNQKKQVVVNLWSLDGTYRIQFCFSTISIQYCLWLASTIFWFKPKFLLQMVVQLLLLLHQVWVQIL